MYTLLIEFKQARIAGRGWPGIFSSASWFDMLMADHFSLPTKINR